MKTKSGPKAGTRRKKDPANVRQALIDAVIKIASTSGVSNITVSHVCKDAGVTKGALFHHFENREALIVAMVNHLTEQLDAEIDESIANDSVPYGSFTRAYIKTTLIEDSEYGRIWASLLLSDATINALAAKWFGKRLKKHFKTDSDPRLELIRYSADGAWLALVTDYVEGIDIGKIKKRLLAMTLE